MEKKELKPEIRDTKLLLRESMPIPKNMLIELIGACNHRCIFCANDKRQNKNKQMEIGLCKKILSDAYNAGVREVGFYRGGEPLLFSDLGTVVKYAKDCGYSYIYLTTNGSLATPERIRPVIDTGIDSIKFSINAGTPATYKLIHGKDDFDKVIRNVKDAVQYSRMKNMNIGFFVTYIQCKLNRGEYDELKKVLSGWIDGFYDYEVYNQGGQMYEINNGIALSDMSPMKAPCNMVFDRLHVNCEGFLSACCVDFDNNLNVADLNKQDIYSAWNSVLIRQLRRDHLKNSIHPNCMCYNCIENVNNEIFPLERIYQ